MAAAREPRRAWIEHAAWAAVDYMNHDVDVDLAYCVLAKLVSEMLDENCTGVYMPRERSMVPNDESLYSELQRIASSRERASVRLLRLNRAGPARAGQGPAYQRLQHRSQCLGPGG